MVGWIGIPIQGPKEDLQNRISTFRQYTKLVDKVKVRAENVYVMGFHVV